MKNNNTNTELNQKRKQFKPKDKLSIQKGLIEIETTLNQEKKKLGYNDCDREQFLNLDIDELEQDKADQVINLQNRYKDYLEQIHEEENTIYIEPAKIHEIIADTEKLLTKNKENTIYQQSGRLVHVTEIPTCSVQDAIGRKKAPYTTVIKEIDQAFLTVYLTKIGKFKIFDARSESIKSIDCPEKISRYLIAQKKWNLPVLMGIINAPTLRADGSILEKPGYDPISGLLFVPGAETFNKILEAPSHEDAIEASKQLLGVLKDFPFESEADRSVVLAAILTSLIRKSIPTAPLFGFSAPKMSSGKSLLADIVSLISTGKINSVLSQAENETEERKRILSVLMEGNSIVCYDNIEKPFGSPALCAILTQQEYKDRILGVSETRTVPTGATFLVNGNNLTFSGDISTRALLCKLDPLMEHPEERNFEIAPRIYVPENRAALVQAGLTILRAYYVAGMPKQNIKQFGRFEKWSDLVRSAVIWIGLSDPCETRKDIEDSDPIRILLKALFNSWFALFGEQTVKIKDLINTAQEIIEDDKQEHRESLKEALLELAPDSKNGINQRSLGKKFFHYKKRNEDGFRLEDAGSHQGAKCWRIKKMNS